MIFRIMVIISLFLVQMMSYADDSENLNAGYAKLIALSSTNDISASTLSADDGLKYSKYSLPYDFTDLDESDHYAMSVRLRGSYLKVKGADIEMGSLGVYYPRWNMLSLTASPRITFTLSDTLALNNEFEFGYTKINSQSTYQGDAQTHALLRDDNLLEWSMNTFHLAPKIGLISRYTVNNKDEINVYSDIAYMYIDTPGNTAHSGFKSSFGTWSFGGEYVITHLFKLKEQPFNVVISNDIGGFYGKGYRDLSFGFINNTSLALEMPINLNNSRLKMKVGIGYLSSDRARGQMFIFEIK